jgi:hypothetical protein
MARSSIGTPWLKMWVEPRQTIRSIVKRDPKYLFKSLCIIYGFPMLLHFAQTQSLGGRLSLIAILGGAILFAFFVGMIGISITSFLLHFTGKWIGGAASFSYVRAAVAWSNVTNVVNSIIWLILVGLFKEQVFFQTFPANVLVGYQGVVLGFLFFAQCVVTVWSFIILLKSLGEVQGFSAWKALLNVIMPAAALIAVFGLIALFIWWSGGAIHAV